MQKEARAHLLRERLRQLFPASSAPLPRAKRAPTESAKRGTTCTGLVPLGDFTLRHQVQWVRVPDERKVETLRAKDGDNAAALVRIATAPDVPIPGCRHSLPSYAAKMPKKPKARTKAPQKDFAQNALSIVLKATGSKQLVEPRVVKMPKRTRAKAP